jgi:AcrR family transcriptional regulator
VDEICHAAAIAKGSFYRHYGSKEELFFAASRTAANRAITQFLIATSENRSPEFGFQQLISAVGPYLSIFLILASQASRQRNEYLEELRVVSELIREAANAQVDGINDGKDDLFSQALAGATQRLIAGCVDPSLAAVETLRQIAN